jgi:MFS transporter, DHA2 family, multidrug resistance protein
LPAGVPAPEAEAARDTLGGALEAVEQLPDGRGAALLDAAQEAFTQGLQVAAVAGAAIAVATAVLAVLFLRRTGAGPPPERAETQPDAAVEAVGP